MLPIACKSEGKGVLRGEPYHWGVGTRNSRPYICDYTYRVAPKKIEKSRITSLAAFYELLSFSGLLYTVYTSVGKTISTSNKIEIGCIGSIPLLVAWRYLSGTGRCKRGTFRPGNGDQNLAPRIQ